jgi:predicted nucleotidyltransferase component of viral defense system
MLTTYEPEELLGTKLRALYQRKKGRDLFDLFTAMQRLEPDVDKILASYKVYMKADGGKAVSAKEVMLNLEKKMNDSTFLGDMTALLEPKIKYDPNEAFEFVKKELIERI